MNDEMNGKKVFDCEVSGKVLLSII